MTELALQMPPSLEWDVVPAGISGIDQARLNHVFGQLDDKINALARKIEAHRQYPTGGPAAAGGSTRKCQMICKDLQGDSQLRCLRQCVRPVVKAADLEDLRLEFTIDMQRLDRDLPLRQNFERHQRAPATIEPTEAEASLIADLYAMPLATAALPDEAWSRAMNVVKADRYVAQREALVQNWRLRSDSYSPDAKEELARKINRHDSDNILMDTAQQFQ